MKLTGRLDKEAAEYLGRKEGTEILIPLELQSESTVKREAVILVSPDGTEKQSVRESRIPRKVIGLKVPAGFQTNNGFGFGGLWIKPQD